MPHKKPEAARQPDKWAVAVAAGSFILGALVYALVDRLVWRLHASNAWFGYLFVLPILGLLCGAVIHFFAGDRELREIAGAGFGAGTLLTSSIIVLPGAENNPLTSLVFMAALAGVAFGIGFAFGPAAAAAARYLLGRDKPKF